MSNRIYGFLFIFISWFFLSGCQSVTNYNNEKEIDLLNRYGLGPQYEIAFNTKNWKKSNVQFDTGGYFKLYIPSANPSSSEKILINYGKGIHTSLIDSMNQVLTVQSSFPCASFNHKIFSQTNNILSFITEIRGCHGQESALVTIRKVFNQADGQYSIMYSANPEIVPASRIVEMKARVLSAQMVYKP